MNFFELQEKIWEKWERLGINKTDIQKKGKYILDMFPYPSGSGLHVGHRRGYVLSDVMAKIYKMSQDEVLHPMGFDSFGLPAENHAIKTGKHPGITTYEAIEIFKRQLRLAGNWYDWDLEVITCDPLYYKWNQWFFLQMYKEGFVYRGEAPVNWCPHDLTVLANEQVKDGCCERCGTVVEKKFLTQWFFKITEFADSLYANIDKLNWPERVKLMQKNWIGPSKGTIFKMKVFEGDKEKFELEVFTTRIDTVFGMTYVALSAEKAYLLIKEGLISDESYEFINNILKQSEAERTGDEKLGYKLPYKVENPFNGKLVDLWISNYIIGTYGTGAVMAVPAHDKRDFEFAKKYGIDIVPTVFPKEFIGIVTSELSEEAKKLADENEVFYKKTDKYYIWSDILNLDFLKYWLKNYVKVYDEDYFYYDNGYKSKYNKFDYRNFMFIENTAYTGKGIIYTAVV